MAKVFPFRPYRYAPAAGPLEKLLTQPYDKISPEMQKKYYANDPKNLVRVILGEKRDGDTEASNVYTRSGEFFRQWIADGTLNQDAEPAFYAYFQKFHLPDDPDTRLTRKGFIGLGEVVDYSANIVHRHELTLSGPKKDRRQVLEHTGAHFGQIFMLYPDKEGAVDAILTEAAQGEHTAQLTDEYGVIHTIWTIADPAKVAAVQALMSDKKLLIADGHHRYETAMAYHKDNPEKPGADKVMMTCVNMYSSGLRILGTHRVVKSLESFDAEAVRKEIAADFKMTRYDSVGELRKHWHRPDEELVRIGAVFAGDSNAYLFERKRMPGDLDVSILHSTILKEALGISDEAVRDEKYLKYVRGIEPAVELTRSGGYQVAFLLEPPTIEQTADVSFGGGVMPQKSTDFYPKLMTGMAIYKLDS